MDADESGKLPLRHASFVDCLHADAAGQLLATHGNFVQTGDLHLYVDAFEAEAGDGLCRL
jgi:hypothetical protein